MPDEFGKNRMVFVREDIKPEDTPSCKVYGLDTDERELVRLKSIEITIEYHGKCLFLKDRASSIIPILESIGYEFYNVSDNVDGMDAENVVVVWRYMKKI